MDRIPNAAKETLARAIAKIEAEVRDGVTHGHFDLTVSCKIANNGKRELVVKAGKNHKYLIPEEELKQFA